MGGARGAEQRSRQGQRDGVGGGMTLLDPMKSWKDFDSSSS